jgi:tRNA A37 threonylcarbamoyladenosine modification protein TsaB
MLEITQYMHKVIIQTAVKPHFAYDSETDAIIEFDTHEEFYKVMEQVPLTSDTKIYVNRGPGSYSGIRVGLAYVQGLIHGGLISPQNVLYFTSFTMAHQVETDLFLKAWPRHGGTFDIAKGYFYSAETKEIHYTQLKDISPETTVMIEQNDDFDETNGMTTIRTEDTVNDESLSQLLIQRELFTEDGEPLYINPVNITA